MSRVNAHGQPIGDPVVDWTPRPFPAPVTLEGRYVRVEPLAAEHAEPLFEATCGAGAGGLWTYLSQDEPASEPEMGELIAGLVARPDMVPHALVPAQGVGPAGFASYMRVDAANGVIELGGITLGKRLQRTRAATEALHLLIRHAFETLGYRRFEWKCDSLNEPSRRAAARLGLRYEGCFRNHVVTKGRNRDTDWFALTDAEWPAVRAAHERWLDPVNFDDAGFQRTSLSDLTSTRR